MTIPQLTLPRIAAIVLLIGSLVLLADGTARVELARAVGASLHDGARVVGHISATDE